MPIRKSYTDEASGAVYPVAIWVIQGVSVRHQQQAADIFVHVFVDAAAAVSKQPVATPVFRVGPALFDTVWTPTSQFQSLTTRAYAYLKQLPELAGGVDA